MRFGHVQRTRARHAHRRGDVILFRSPNRHGDRFWTIVVSLLVMVVIAIPINVLSNHSMDASQARWMGPLLTSLAIPLMVIVLAIAMPQQSMLISRRGLCMASTFRRRRAWVRWDRITGVRPGMSAIRLTTGAVLIPSGGLPGAVRQELKAELKKHLELRFDLSTRTVHLQRLHRARERWTCPWILDRLALVGLAFSVTAAQLAKCLCCTRPVVAVSVLGLFAVCTFVLLTIHGRRMDRDHWIRPRPST